MDFGGRAVLVTGASGNLGGAVCERLLRGGARVAGVIHREAEREPLLSRLRAVAPGPDLVELFAAELAAEASVEGAYAAAEERLGGLWAAVHCAGGWSGAPLVDTTLEEFDRLIALNLRSAFLCSRAAARRLVPRGDGRIVNVAAFGPAFGVGTGGQAVYAASKAGVVALTRALADELAKTRVRASCVAPGTMRTGANARGMPGADPERWVPLEEVAEAIAFLASPAAAAVNGAVVPLPSR